MSSLFTHGTEDAVAARLERPIADVDQADRRPVEHPVDSNAVRWVFAATLAFWFVVYAAGSTFF